MLNIRRELLTLLLPLSLCVCVCTQNTALVYGVYLQFAGMRGSYVAYSAPDRIGMELEQNTQVPSDIRVQNIRAKCQSRLHYLHQ